MAAFYLAIALTGTMPVELVAEERVEVVHFNRHYFDGQRTPLEQVWWEAWRDDPPGHSIIAWRLAKPGTAASPIPRFNAATGEWDSIWFDGDILRRVRAPSFRESWTVGEDPELLDRKRHPDWKQSRRELSKPLSP